ncbi:MAG: hypothetical protein WCN95_14855 [bacterium]
MNGMPRHFLFEHWRRAGELLLSHRREIACCVYREYRQVGRNGWRGGYLDPAHLRFRGHVTEQQLENATVFRPTGAAVDLVDSALRFGRYAVRCLQQKPKCFEGIEGLARDSERVEKSEPLSVAGVVVRNVNRAILKQGQNCGTEACPFQPLQNDKGTTARLLIAPVKTAVPLV